MFHVSALSCKQWTSNRGQPKLQYIQGNKVTCGKNCRSLHLITVRVVTYEIQVVLLKRPIMRQRILLSCQMGTGLPKPLNAQFVVRFHVEIWNQEELHLGDKSLCSAKEEWPSSIRDQSPELFPPLLWWNRPWLVLHFKPLHEGSNDTVNVIDYGLNVLILQKLHCYASVRQWQSTWEKILYASQSSNTMAIHLY